LRFRAPNGGGALAYGATHPRAQLFGKTICRTNSARKLVLTFDDGPNPAITPKLLDLLDRYNARATFFLIGRYVRECPELVRQTVSRGHLVGITPKRIRIFSASRAERSGLSCASATTRFRVRWARPEWFRPPFGMRNPWVVPAACELGYRTSCGRCFPVIGGRNLRNG